MLLALGVTMALLIGGVVLLLRGADWFMDGVGDLARMLGVSTVALGAVLAGLEPEEMLTAALPVMVAAHLVLLGLIWRGRMGRAAGMIFVAAYVAYLAVVVIAR